MQVQSEVALDVPMAVVRPCVRAYVVHHLPCTSTTRVFNCIVQSNQPMTDLEGDVEVVTLIGDTIVPSYHSRPSGIEMLHFIAQPSRASQVDIVMTISFFSWHVILVPTVHLRSKSLFTFVQSWIHVCFPIFSHANPFPPARPKVLFRC